MFDDNNKYYLIIIIVGGTAALIQRTLRILVTCGMAIIDVLVCE